MDFARRVFLWAGIYGLLVLLPMFFLEHKLGVAFPPATNHPEQYYGFIGVALAWQFAFLLIASDVRRYRPLILPAIAEKFVPSGTAIWLFVFGRIEALTLVPFLVDFILGCLFVASYFRSSGRST
jgi:hypothetical protein